MTDAEIDRLTRAICKPAVRVSWDGTITVDPKRIWVSARDARRALENLEAWCKKRDERSGGDE